MKKKVHKNQNYAGECYVSDDESSAYILSDDVKELFLDENALIEFLEDFDIFHVDSIKEMGQGASLKIEMHPALESYFVNDENSGLLSIWLKNKYIIVEYMSEACAQEDCGVEIPDYIRIR